MPRTAQIVRHEGHRLAVISLLGAGHRRPVSAPLQMKIRSDPAASRYGVHGSDQTPQLNASISAHWMLLHNPAAASADGARNLRPVHERLYIFHCRAETKTTSQPITTYLYIYMYIHTYNLCDGFFIEENIGRWWDVWFVLMFHGKSDFSCPRKTDSENGFEQMLFTESTNAIDAQPETIFCDSRTTSKILNNISYYNLFKSYFII